MMGPERSRGDYEGFHRPVCPHAQGHTAMHSKYKILAPFLHSQDTGPSFLLCVWSSNAIGGSDSNSALEIASLIKLVLRVRGWKSVLPWRRPQTVKLTQEVGSLSSWCSQCWLSPEAFHRAGHSDSCTPGVFPVSWRHTDTWGLCFCGALCEQRTFFPTSSGGNPHSQDGRQ